MSINDGGSSGSGSNDSSRGWSCGRRGSNSNARTSAGIADASRARRCVGGDAARSDGHLTNLQRRFRRSDRGTASLVVIHRYGCCWKVCGCTAKILCQC